MPAESTGVRPEGLNVAGWLTNGGSIAPRSSSQRTPPLRVSRSLADQVSPNQIAQVGRGMSIVQSPKFWSKRCTEASSPDRSHFVGSSQAAAGDGCVVPVRPVNGEPQSQYDERTVRWSLPERV